MQLLLLLRQLLLYFVHTYVCTLSVSLKLTISLIISLLWLTLLVLNRIAELEKSLIDVSNEAINRQKQLEHDHQKEYALQYSIVYIICICACIHRVERIFNDCASKLNQVNKNHKSVVAQKDLELKKCPCKYTILYYTYCTYVHARAVN